MQRSICHTEPQSAPTGFAERRSADRTRMVYRLVHVTHGDDEGLARCRNISDGGMKLELTMPVRVGARLTVALSSSFACAGRVIWARGGECGLAFDSPIDSAGYLRESALEAAAETGCAPRLKADVRAVIRWDGRTHEAVSSEVSQHGMTVRHDGAFRAGLRVTVMLGEGRERPGVVRWSRGELADLVLLEPFSVAELGSVGALAAR